MHTARDRIGGFKHPGDQERLYVVYDVFAADDWPVPAEELDVETSFGSTHLRRSGPVGGTPIVLIHPSSATSIGWYRLVEPLAAQHPVIAVDTIGTAGRSVQTAPVTNAQDLARRLDEALDVVGVSIACTWSASPRGLDRWPTWRTPHGRTG